MNRRAFVATLLAAPAALFAITTTKPPTVRRRAALVRSDLYAPYATSHYQRLYTKLEYRDVRNINDDCRSLWINGTSANGERDVFYQHERRTEQGWRPTSTFRYSHRDDINNRIISYPKVHVDLSLDIVPATAEAKVPWMKGVVAIARWTEMEKGV